jgi:hypothetical protein
MLTEDCIDPIKKSLSFDKTHAEKRPQEARATPDFFAIRIGVSDDAKELKPTF